MERIAILDHDEHRLYVEDIDEEGLQEKYGGEEQKYIEDNYDMEHYSWNYITDALYIPAPPPYDDPIEINFEDMANT